MPTVRMAGVVAATSTGQLRADEVAALLLELPLLVDMGPLGITAAVDAVDAELGLVRLGYAGPSKLRKAVEVQLRAALREADPRVRRVEFVG